MAIGSVAGALWLRDVRNRISPSCMAARRNFRLRLSSWLDHARLLASAALTVIGVSAQTFTTTVDQHGAVVNSGPALRRPSRGDSSGIALGGTPIGAPIVGWVAERGPALGAGIAAAAGFAAALVGIGS